MFEDAGSCVELDLLLLLVHSIHILQLAALISCFEAWEEFETSSFAGHYLSDMLLALYILSHLLAVTASFKCKDQNNRSVDW